MYVKRTGHDAETQLNNTDSELFILCLLLTTRNNTDGSDARDLGALTPRFRSRRTLP